MKPAVFFISFCFIFCLVTDISYGGAMLYRVQQMKAMKQQQQQEEYQEYMQEQQGNQTQGQQQAPATPTYQQTVDQHNQAIAQAILDAHNQSVSSGYLPSGSTTAANPAANSMPQQVTPPVSSTEVKDVVDLSEVWKKLDTKSTVWPLLIDDQSKVLTVSEYISRYHDQGVTITAPPLHYVQLIDQITEQNPQMLQQPFGDLLKLLAIIDYDFDNGMNKDDLARKVLGEAEFEANKKRFTQPEQPAQPTQQ
jgi:hypothetical protein